MNNLHEALLAENGPTFWKCWRSKFESRPGCTEVYGFVDPYVIANNFEGTFLEFTLRIMISMLQRYTTNTYYGVKTTLATLFNLIVLSPPKF